MGQLRVHGAKRADFVESVAASVVRTRSKVTVFDVSHMGQLRVHGAKRADFVESVVVGGIKDLKPGSGCLSLLTTDQGTIIDDSVISAHEDHIYMVVNAGCHDKDKQRIDELLAKFQQQHGADAASVCHGVDENALLAVQGPEAERVLNPLVPFDLAELKFMQGKPCKLFGQDAYVTRCGYTGEDGFEVSVCKDKAVHLCEELIGGGAEMAALGARDALRLEAGLCLYGHDIDEATLPVEAALMWTIPKRRRAEGGFPGHAQIMKAFGTKPVPRRRVGLLATGAPPREGSDVLVDGEVVGQVCSGTFSPTLKRPIAMAYLPTRRPLGTIETRVRGKAYPAELTKMPFVPHQYKN